MGFDMADMNKLRSEFEDWFKTTEMYKVLLDYITIHQPNLKSPLVKTGKSYRNSMVQASWLGWQEKAKAQAVPEQIADDIQSWIAVESIQAMELDGEAFVVGANELAEFIEQLVKSESGAEG